jgi:hypothetical protein
MARGCFRRINHLGAYMLGQPLLHQQGFRIIPQTIYNLHMDTFQKPQ